MHITSTLFSSIILPYLFTLTSNFVAYSLDWDDTYGLTFQQANCYKTPKFPRLYFKLFHNLPIGPPHVLLEINSTLSPFNESDINNFSSIHFIRAGPVCPDPIEFSNKGLRFSQWKIDMNMYIGIRREKFAEISLSLDKEFDFTLERVFDKNKRFGLLIKFKRDGSEYIPKYWEMSNLAMFLILIDFPENDGAVAVTPIYENGMVPSEHISQIRVENIVDDHRVSYIEVPAYGCGSDSNIDSNEIVIAFNNTQNGRLELAARYLFPKIFGDDDNDQVYEKGISLLNNDTASLGIQRRQVRQKSYIYLMQTTNRKSVCADGRKHHLSLSPNGVVVRAYSTKEELISKGASVEFYSHVPVSDACY